jgi:hypothetical protein
MEIEKNLIIILSLIITYIPIAGLLLVSIRKENEKRERHIAEYKRLLFLSQRRKSK